MGNTYEQLLDRQELINRIEQKSHTKVITFFKNSLNHNGMITEQTVDAFGFAIDTVGSYDPVMVIIDSQGGLTDSGYCIASTLARRSSRTLAVVPEEALSAATMIALGNKELVMFSDARLSPIDPQYIYKGQYVSALDFLDNRDHVIRAAAQRQIALAEENLRAVCIAKLTGKKLDPFIERFLLKDKKHAAHGSHIYSDEVRKLGLKVKKQMKPSLQLDTDIKALHTLYKKHTFTVTDPPTIIEYTRFPIVTTKSSSDTAISEEKYFQL